MQLKHGLWLTLVDEGEEATPVACDVTERRPGCWVLDAMVPPQVYPVRFVAAQLRLDGQFLGMVRLPQSVTTVTHQPLDFRIEFPVDESRLEMAKAGSARR